ncbi:unnamed protein product, partial [Rotaria sordida]
MSLEKAALEIK